MSSSSSTNDDDVDDIIKRFLEHHYPDVARRARGTIAAATKHDSLAKDFYFNCRRFDTRQSTNADLQYLRALFGDVRLYCRGMNRFSDAVYPDYDANTICINDRQFAILAHVALQQRPVAFAELTRPEEYVVVLSEDIRVVASSSRGLERTMLLREALEIFAGQWIVRSNRADDDSWFGLTRNGIEIHPLEDWIDIVHDRTLAELLFSNNQKYDLFLMEATIGKWASFVKLREGDNAVMQFADRKFNEQAFLENFAAVAPEKTFPGCMVYLRDEKHYLHEVLFRCDKILHVRPRKKYTEIADTSFEPEQQRPAATAAESTADARAEDDDNKEQNGRPAAQKDFGVMTEAEAKRQECRNRLRARLQRRKKKTL